tara:strand:- start:2048 stop:2251 length:204 start_codon:yes stop_codon:yes gene_type:complete
MNCYWIYSHFHDEQTKRIFELLPEDLKDYFYSVIQMADEGLHELYSDSEDEESDIEEDEPDEMDEDY